MVFSWVGDTRQVPSRGCGWSVDRDGQAQPGPNKDREELLAEVLLELDTGGSCNEVRAAQSAKGTGFG